jgi:hypothetical protein
MASRLKRVFETTRAESADAMSHHATHGSLARDDKNRKVAVA